MSYRDGKWSVSCAAHSHPGSRGAHTFGNARIPERRRRKPRILDEREQKERYREADRKALDAHVAIGKLFDRFEADAKAEHVKAVESLPFAAKVFYYFTVGLRIFGLGVWWITPKPLGLIPFFLFIFSANYMQTQIASRYQVKLLVRD